MKTRADTPLGRLAKAARPTRPWLRVKASGWWARVLITAGARQQTHQDARANGRTWSDRDLTGAHLTGEYLVAAYLVSAGLTGADLTGADLTGADLTRAGLTRADLTEANLTEANLTRANLTEANLTEANLTRANLTEANLTRANLTEANLIAVLWSEQTRWPSDFGAVMRARSVPLGGGRWRVEGSGNSGADLSEPLVPVG